MNKRMNVGKTTYTCFQLDLQELHSLILYFPILCSNVQNQIWGNKAFSSLKKIN